MKLHPKRRGVWPLYLRLAGFHFSEMAAVVEVTVEFDEQRDVSPMGSRQSGALHFPLAVLHQSYS